MSDAQPVVTGQEILDRIEMDVDAESLARADQLRVAARVFQDSGDAANAERAEWERMAFQFMWGSQTRKSRGDWFGPLLEAVDAAGKPVVWPDKRLVTAAILDYWRDRAVRSSNPHVQARMSDLLWEFGARPNVTMAEQAIRSYLEIARRHYQTNDQLRISYTVRHLERALILASQINNKELRDAALRGHREAFDAILAQGERPLVPCSELINSMLTQGRDIDLTDVDGRLDALEDWMGQHPELVDSLLRNSVVDIRIEVARLRGDSGGIQRLRLRQAADIEAEGDAMNRMGAAAMLAQSRFQQALTMFADLGATDDVNRLKTKLADVSPRTLGELKVISSEVAVPTDHLTALANLLRQFSVRQALQIIASSNWWIPSAAEARQYVARMKKVTPFLSMVSKVLLDQDGNPFALSGLERDRHDILEYIYQTVFTHAHLAMRTAFDTVREMGVTSDDFTAVLRQMSWLDQGRLEILRDAFDAYLRRSYVAAIHILIPQFEGAVRDLARKIGIVAIATRGKRITPQTLDTILKNPDMQRGLGEDFVLTLQALLVDEVGVLIRHRAMHGNYSHISNFGQDKAEILIYLFLHLASYRIGPGPAKAAAGPEVPSAEPGPRAVESARPALDAEQARRRDASAH